MDCLRNGERVGDYVVDGILGRGTESEVYLVQGDDGSWWALKVILDADPTRVDRLRREAVVRTTLDHPHIVPAHEVLLVGRHAALVMDFVEGPSLRVWLAQQRLSIEQAMAVFAGITQAVAAAHAQGIIHRDLRPENVLMQPTAHQTLIPRIADWGLARVDPVGALGGLTTVHTGLGRSGYAAPEQIRDASAVTPAADVFSLGCLLYELLAGEGPFHGLSELEAAEAARKRRYTPIHARVPELPQEISALVEDLLSPRTDQRPPDAGAVWARLGAIDLFEPTWSPMAWIAMIGTPLFASAILGWLVTR